MFEVREKLYEAAGTEILRATESPSGGRVVLKVLDPRRCSERRLQRLKTAYEFALRLNTAAVVKPLALGTYEGMPALILEDCGSESLDRQMGAPMAASRFLPLAIRIAAAVANVHERGVLHRDLKPSNILVHPDSGEQKITDFGIAATLPSQRQCPEALIERP